MLISCWWGLTMRTICTKQWPIKAWLLVTVETRLGVTVASGSPSEHQKKTLCCWRWWRQPSKKLPTVTLYRMVFSRIIPVLISFTKSLHFLKDWLNFYCWFLNFCNIYWHLHFFNQFDKIHILTNGKWSYWWYASFHYGKTHWLFLRYGPFPYCCLVSETSRLVRCQASFSKNVFHT